MWKCSRNVGVWYTPGLSGSSRLTRRKVSDVQVLDRAVVLLETIRKRSGIGLTPLSKESSLALSTTKRLVDALCRHDLVYRSADGRYTIGPRFLRLITQSPDRRRLVDLARPVLEKTMRTLGEDIALAVLQGQEAAIVLRVLGPQALKIVAPVGSPVSLNCGYRRVLLAYQPPDFIRRYVRDTRFTKYTDATITVKSEIFAALERVRRDGYGVSRGEYVSDAGGVAAPVFSSEQTLAAVIFSYVPMLRFGPKQTAKHVAAITKAARSLSELLAAVAPQ